VPLPTYFLDPAWLVRTNAQNESLYFLCVKTLGLLIKRVECSQFGDFCAMPVCIALRRPIVEFFRLRVQGETVTVAVPLMPAASKILADIV
jgi:hypothetical protein